MASLRSTLMAPRRANRSHGARFCQSGRAARQRRSSARSRAQAPVGAGRQILQRQRAEARACELRTGCPTARHMRRTWRLRPSRIVSSISRAPSRRTRAGAVGPSSSCDALAQRRERIGADRAAAAACAVGLGHLEARVGQAVGELAVVGEQDQAAAVDVQAPDRVEAQPAAGTSSSTVRPPVRVARGGDHAQGLVQRRRRTRGSGPAIGAAVERHRAVLVDVASRVGDDLPADASPGPRRSAPRRAPRGDARVGEKLG